MIFEAGQKPGGACDAGPAVGHAFLLKDGTLARGHAGPHREVVKASVPLCQEHMEAAAVKGIAFSRLGQPRKDWSCHWAAALVRAKAPAPVVEDEPQVTPKQGKGEEAGGKPEKK